MRSLWLSLLLVPISSISCNRAPSSSIKVTNGIPTGDFPSVVYIRGVDGACTGTFIGDDVLLTAAHCVHSIPGTKDFKPVVIPALNAVSTHIVMHPDYVDKADTDLALIYFPKGTAPAISPISATTAKSSDKITVVGFGDNHYDDNSSVGGGLKRMGTNTIKKNAGGVIEMDGASQRAPEGNSPTGEKSSVGHGDSGGPMFNEKGEIVGVASRVLKIEQDGKSIVASAHTELHSAASQSFLTASLKNRPAPALETDFVTLCRTGSGLTRESVLFLYELASQIQSAGNLTADFSLETCKALHAILARSYSLDFSPLYSTSSLDPDVIRTEVPKPRFDLRVLQSLKNLEYLNLPNLGITNLAGIEQLSALTDLKLDFNAIQDISALEKLPLLRNVSLKANPITSFVVLANLGNLRSLEVSKPHQDKVPKLFRAALEGTWSQACLIDEEDKTYSKSILVFSKPDGFSSTTVTYGNDPTCAPGSITTITKMWLGIVFLPSSTQSWLVNINNSNSYNVTAYTDEAVEAHKANCKDIQKGREAVCSSPSLSGTIYSILKFDQDQIFVGKDEEGHDSSSEHQRHVTLESAPYTREPAPK